MLLRRNGYPRPLLANAKPPGHLSMSRRILLTFGRNRSRWLRRPLSRLGQSCKHVGSRCSIGSAIDASIIALAYSRFSVGECRGKRYGLLLLNISISASKYAMASFMYGWIRGTMMAMKFSMPSSSTTAVLMT